MQMAAKHDCFLLWSWLMQVVVETGVLCLTSVAWLAKVVWLANQRELFLVPHFSSQSNKI
jgi:hypothetical protein